MIEELAKQSVSVLAKTIEFGALKQAKDRLEKNAQAKKSLEQFYADKVCLERQELSEQDMRALKDQFDVLLLNPDIAAYYKAGQGFSSMLTQFHQMIDLFIDQEMDGNGTHTS